MLRNKDGVMKMITDNALMSLISSVEYRDSCCFSKGHLMNSGKVQATVKRS